VIASRHRSGDLGPELNGEALGKRIIVVLSIVGHAHDCLPVDLASTGELGLCSCRGGGNQCLCRRLLGVVCIQINGGYIETGDAISKPRKCIAFGDGAIAVGCYYLYCGPDMGWNELCGHCPDVLDRFQGRCRAVPELLEYQR